MPVLWKGLHLLLRTINYSKFSRSVKEFFHGSLVSALWNLSGTPATAKREDRATYGEYLTLRIAQDLTSKGIKGMSQRSIKDFRQFYQTYPHILQPFAANFTELSIGQPLVAQLQIVDNELLSAKLTPENLLAHFSFRHFTALMRINNSYIFEFIGFKGVTL